MQSVKQCFVSAATPQVGHKLFEHLSCILFFLTRGLFLTNHFFHTAEQVQKHIFFLVILSDTTYVEN